MPYHSRSCSQGEQQGQGALLKQCFSLHKGMLGCRKQAASCILLDILPSFSLIPEFPKHTEPLWRHPLVRTGREMEISLGEKISQKKSGLSPSIPVLVHNSLISMVGIHNKRIKVSCFHFFKTKTKKSETILSCSAVVISSAARRQYSCFPVRIATNPLFYMTNVTLSNNSKKLTSCSCVSKVATVRLRNVFEGRFKKN